MSPPTSRWFLASPIIRPWSWSPRMWRRLVGQKVIEISYYLRFKGRSSISDFFLYVVGYLSGSHVDRHDRRSMFLRNFCEHLSGHMMPHPWSYRDENLKSNVLISSSKLISMTYTPIFYRLTGDFSTRGFKPKCCSSILSLLTLLRVLHTTIILHNILCRAITLPMIGVD
jgi:hypothetical protein